MRSARQFLRTSILIAALTIPLSGYGLTGTTLAQFPWNDGDRSFGRVVSGETFAGPFALDVDTNGNVHIPDIHQGRIVVLTPNGTWLRDYTVPDLTPRLRAFIAGDGKRIFMINDQTIAVVDEKGTRVNAFDLGFTLPNFVARGKDWFVAIREGKNGRSLVFDQALEAMRDLSLQTPSGSIPVVRDEWSRMWTPAAIDMKRIRPGSWDLSEQVFFVRSNAKGGSLWALPPKPGSQTFFLVDPDGATSRVESIEWQQTVAGSGFWTAADESLSIYKLFLDERALTVTKYVW